MAPEKPVVQFVQFAATVRCMDDPSAFQAVRNIAQAWQEKGLKAQYWGASVERAKEFYWLLLWQSHAHAAAIKADPSYALFVTKRQALSTGLVEDLHVSFSGNPRRSLEAPVTELDIYVTQDADAAETQEVHERVRRLTYRVESLLARGFIALSWGVPIEDGARGVYLGGWRSIEDHMNLGSLDAQTVFVAECEELFNSFKDLSVTHVHFKPHDP